MVTTTLEPEMIRHFTFLMLVASCGCGRKELPQPTDHVHDLGGRRLEIVHGGSYSGSGFSRGKHTAWFITSAYSVHLHKADLFVNDIHYGVTHSNDTIHITDGRVTVNMTERPGRFPTPDQVEILHPTLHQHYVFKRHLVLASAKSSCMGRVSSLFGGENLFVNDLSIDIQEGKLYVNKKNCARVSSTDLVYANDMGVFVLTNALTSQDGWTLAELASFATNGTELLRVWPARAYVTIEKQMWGSNKTN